MHFFVKFVMARVYFVSLDASRFEVRGGLCSEVVALTICKPRNSQKILNFFIDGKGRNR